MIFVVLTQPIKTPEKLSSEARWLQNNMEKAWQRKGAAPPMPSTYRQEGLAVSICILKFPGVSILFLPLHSLQD